METEQLDTEALKQKLRQFTGTGTWWRVRLAPGVTYTDGVKYLSETVGAHWLIEEIALAQLHNKAVRPHPFQVWTLTVETRGGELKCTDGNDNVLFTKRITFTDFPLDEIVLWCVDKVILLPSEY
jgi:hypothetical protein